jgi:hypothetical protein
MFTSVKRSAVLAREVVRLEPRYAGEAEALAALFEHPERAATAALPDRIVAARRGATLRAWADGLPAWNARASERIGFLRQIGQDPHLVRLGQQLLAADFGGTTLAQGLDAAGAVFAGDLILERSVIGGALRLDGADVLARCDAADVRIGHEITAEQARFAGPVVLAGATIARSARFGYAAFMSDLILDRARIDKEMWLRHARIAGEIQMRGAHLRSDAGLGACLYGKAASFDGTAFDDTVSFEGATFQDRLSLDGCVFGGRLRLAGLTLGAGLSVAGTRFRGEIIPPLDQIVASASTPREMLATLRKALGAE